MLAVRRTPMAFHSSCRPFSSLETRRRLPFAALVSHPPPFSLGAPKAQITRAFVAWASNRTRLGFLQLHARPFPSVSPSVFRSTPLPPSPSRAERRVPAERCSRRGASDHFEISRHRDGLLEDLRRGGRSIAAAGGAIILRYRCNVYQRRSVCGRQKAAGRNDIRVGRFRG